MTRAFNIVVSILALVGAIGLVLFSRSWLEFYGWISWQVATPMPRASTELTNASVAAIFLTVGWALAACAIIIRTRDYILTPMGRALGVMAGIVLVFASCISALILTNAKSWFVAIATGTVTPSVRETEEMISRGSSLTVVSAIIVFATALLLLSSVVGWSKRDERKRPQSTLYFITGAISVACAVIVVLLMVVIGVRGHEITEMAIAGGSTKPSELMTRMFSIASASIMTFSALLGQGVMFVIAVVVSPRAVLAADQDA